MMCQFHSGTMERPNPWRVIGLPPPRPRYHSNPMACCPTSSPSVACHAARRSCFHGSAIACCHETEMLRQLASGGWPLWTPVPVPVANTLVGTAGYRRNGASGCRSNNTRKSMTSFSISAILGSGSTSEERKTREDQTTKTIIIRPWDDEVSSDLSSCSKEWRKSEEDCGEEDMETNRNDDDEEEEEEEEEIDVGGGGQQTEGGLGKGSAMDCPLDALLRMTSQTHFLHQRNNNKNTQQSTTTTTTTNGYTSDDSGGSPQFPSPSKTNPSSSLFHRSSSHPVKKRRKTRTAFTNHQIFQLEKRFLYQKYLTPTDRDELSLTLRLSNSQVITWFQNRRAKLKRDLEELKADVSAAKALGNEPSTSVLSRLDELIKANDSGLKKKDRNAAGDTCRPPVTKSPANKTSFRAVRADEETAVSSTTAKDTNNLCC